MFLSFRAATIKSSSADKHIALDSLIIIYNRLENVNLFFHYIYNWSACCHPKRFIWLTTSAFWAKIAMVIRMQLKEKILTVLINAPQGISGQRLASELAVSRNAVWKAIEQLRSDGFIIDAASGKGYCFSNDNTRLCGAELQKHYSGRVEFFENTDSTNRVAKVFAERGAEEGLLVAALSQTAGKGRLGRSFLSPEGGLYFSIVLRPTMSPEESRLLTVAAAVAVAEMLELQSGRGCGIKWVNDIYIDGKKVCGILTEGAFDAETAALKYAILGIGINIFSPQGLPQDIADIADTVFDRDISSRQKAEIIVDIAERFMQFYHALKERKYLDEYRRRSILTGLTVDFTLNGAEHTGTVKGIDADARLIVDENGETLHIGAGDVSVRWRR